MDKNPIKNYPKDSAGRLMTASVPLVSPEDSIGVIEQYLLKNVKKLDSINYVYVVGRSGILKGVISIKEIFRQPKEKKVSAVMIKDFVSVHPHTDQERTAHLALKHSIKAVPVLDKDKRFFGAVLSDTILSTVYRESQEDISRLAGVDHSGLNLDNVSSLALSVSLKHRLPWLIIGLIGGLLAAKLIGLFEHTLAENIILAAFIPLVVYMSSAVGTQVGFFIVRDLAINSKINFPSYALRQLKVVFLIGLIISALLFLIVYVFYGQLALALVLTLAMFLAILSSIITGLFIPYVFSLLRFDPANASGPIATIVQDLTSVMIYLSVARILL